MIEETRPFDIQNYILTQKDQADYLDAALEEGDSSFIAAALGDIARARGVTRFSEESGISREAVYKGLVPGGNPTLATLTRAAHVLGYRLALAKN